MIQRNYFYIIRTRYDALKSPERRLAQRWLQERH